MRNSILLFLLLLLASYCTYSQQSGFQFISPSPGSRLHHRETTISIRKGPVLSWTTSLPGSAIQLSGSVSGQHTYSTILSDDKRTLIIKPDVPFTLGETVTVSLDDQLKTETGSSVGPLQFSFTISPTEVSSPAPMSGENVVAAPVAEPGMGKNLLHISKTSDNPVPLAFPTITENVNNVQPKWNIFLSNMVYDYNITNTPYLMVLNTSMYSDFL